MTIMSYGSPHTTSNNHTIFFILARYTIIYGTIPPPAPPGHHPTRRPHGRPLTLGTVTDVTPAAPTGKTFSRLGTST